MIDKKFKNNTSVLQQWCHSTNTMYCLMSQYKNFASSVVTIVFIWVSERWKWNKLKFKWIKKSSEVNKLVSCLAPPTSLLVSAPPARDRAATGLFCASFLKCQNVFYKSSHKITLVFGKILFYSKVVVRERDFSFCLTRLKFHPEFEQTCGNLHFFLS